MDGPSQTLRRLSPCRSDLKSLYNMAARLRKHPCRKTGSFLPQPRFLCRMGMFYGIMPFGRILPFSAERRCRHAPAGFLR